MAYTTKHTVKRVLLMLLPACMAWAGHAQSFFEDLGKVKDRFNGPLPMRVTVEVRYFKNEGDAAAAVTKRGLVKKDGPDRYYSFFDGKEYLINKKYTLLVDRSKKLMILKDTKPDATRRKDDFSVPGIGREEEAKYHIVRSTTADRILYTVTPRQNPANRMRMELGPDGSRLLKVVYYGGNSYARTEISYSYPPGEVSFAADEFSETRYISKSQKTFVPAKAYAGYELNYSTR